MYYIAIIIISWKMGKRGVNWLNACTVPEKFRSSPEEKEVTEGDPVLRASAGAYQNHNNTVVWHCHTHLKRKN